jgi:hypothetical protein
VRALNHATPGDLDFPADAGAVVAGLKVMAQQLPQLFGQLSDWLERECEAGRVAHDSDTQDDACEAVDGVIDALSRASADAATLAEAQPHNRRPR